MGKTVKKRGSRAYGTQCFPRVLNPASELAGYFQRSLRDRLPSANGDVNRARPVLVTR
jgi:hypothetical protein